MAVQMNTNVRSDFMISDAALPQRMAELDSEKFANVLSDLGSHGDSESTLETIQKALGDLQDNEKFEKALKALDKEIERVSQVDVSEKAASLPKDVKELAKKIVKGEVDIHDVPDEMMSEELMKEIIALMMQIRTNGSVEDDDKEEIFDSIAAFATEKSYAEETSDRIVMELYKIIEKHNERQSEKQQTFLDGISEPIDEDETSPSIVTGEAQSQNEDGLLDQIIENLVDDDISDEIAVSETAASNVTVSETASVEVLADNASVQVGEAVAAQGESAPIIREQTGETTASDVQNAAAQSAAQGEEVIAAVSENEQSDSTQMQFDGQTRKTAKIDESDKSDELEGEIVSFTVKETKVSDSEPSEAPKPVNVSSDNTNRVKNAGEEFEMLKNAKLGKSKSETAENLNSAAANQTITLTRSDGSKVEIKPVEVISQAEKLIEKAVEQTKEQSEYSLVLNPEELGKITVKLIKTADGAVSVTIAAENAHTQRILEQHSELMQNNLRSSGINLESWQTVNESRQETFAQDYNGSSKNPYYRRDDAQDSNDDKGDRTFADIIAAM